MTASENILYMYMTAAGFAILTAALFLIDRHMKKRERRKG